MGVFVFRDVAVPREAHNAAPIVAPNGSFLIFDIYGFLYASESLDGPWRHVATSAIHCNNPAPMFLPNGTAVVACHNGGIYLFACDDLFGRAPWRPLGGALAFPVEWGGNDSPYLHVEDPFLYVDRRGHWHLIFHRYDLRNGYSPNATASNPLLVSGHAFSLDGWNWHYNVVQQPYDSVIRFANGTAQPTSTFERPHLLFDDNKTAMHLISGVAPYFNQCQDCEGAQGAVAHSCPRCKLTQGLDYTFTLVTAHA